MSEFSGNAVSLTTNLLLAVRYPFPLYIVRIGEHRPMPIRAALALAPQLQAAQANRMEDVYKAILYLEGAETTLRGNFAPQVLCRNLSEQHLLCSLPVLAYVADISYRGEELFRRALHAIRDRLGDAFFESTIHVCVGKTQVSSDHTFLKCIHRVCYYFPDDILSLAQRYGDMIIRLHGALPFLTMLDYWCDEQAHGPQEALVEAFESPLTRAAAMILRHSNLSPIPSQEAVEAAFDALSLADRARLLLSDDFKFYNTHASSVKRKLRLLGFDPNIQTIVQTSSDEDRLILLLRCLLHIPDPSAAHVVLEQFCKQSWIARDILATLSDDELRSDEARMRWAQVLINTPTVLRDAATKNESAKNIRQLAQSLSDSSLGAALETALEWHEHIYRLSEQCVRAVRKLIINRFGAQLEQLQDPADTAKVYDAMLQDRAWLETVDEAVAKILDDHLLLNMGTMYGISSEP